MIEVELYYENPGDWNPDYPWQEKLAWIILKNLYNLGQAGAKIAIPDQPLALSEVIDQGLKDLQFNGAKIDLGFMQILLHGKVSAIP